jgi:hypothetical protein
VAGGFRGEERLEEALQAIGLDARSRIGDDQPHEGAGREVRLDVVGGELDVGGLDRHLPPARHCVARVHCEVDDDLTDLASVCPDRPEGGSAVDLHLEVVPEEAVEHRLVLGDDLVEVEHLRLQDLLAPERQQLTGEVRRILHRAADVFQ